VLVANRGEIAERVFRTCHELGIETVAVYSTADVQSRFVRQATHRVCVGPPDASRSYLNVDAVLNAARDLDADAVHPGYGFLSENAAFARAIRDAGCAFLGPSPHAITQMGDKLQSKQVARHANVTTIPGLDDDEISSLEHALEVASNQVGYPVLLKAVAGGGGKGMRVCYDDRDVRDAWPMAKSEALKFFADDRLMIEKYVERPHHIEFQVLCSQNAERVAVFPERECSVQRRNQKIIEETPSCHLQDGTRREMATQVRRLCRAVGYESAGTVEFLVDAEQNFYFLEMNTRLQVRLRLRSYWWGITQKMDPYTRILRADIIPLLLASRTACASSNLHFRTPIYTHPIVMIASTDIMSKRICTLCLQVEHPISEAVCGVDLVKGMLWVGAGWDLPPEFGGNADDDENDDGRVLPYKGHAIEARVYAEDPLRGFLPSTGPLATYVEPSKAGNTPSRYLRMDSGVTAGHNVSPFYDPMISKVVFYSESGRNDAIFGLGQALDEYVIGGGKDGDIRHNAPLVQSVLRHPEFLKGDTPTNFLQTHYPDGFKGVELSPVEWDEFATAAAAIGQYRRELFGQPPLPGSSTADASDVDEKDPEPVIVKFGGLFGKAYRVDFKRTGNTAAVTDLETGETSDAAVRLDSRIPLTYDPERYLAHISLNEKNRAVQVLHETTSGLIPMSMYGAKYDVLLQSLDEHELSRHMHEPISVDTTNLVQSPMPGTLISYAVKAGDSVEEGQELCIVEAMKMQNIVRSPRAGVVAECVVDVGSSLQNDDVIIRFAEE